jgi:hypothetical protein
VNSALWRIGSNAYSEASHRGDVCHEGQITFNEARLLQSEAGGRISYNRQFDRALSERSAHKGPEAAKPGTALIQVRGIECNPAVTGSDNVAQMPLGINEAAD